MCLHRNPSMAVRCAPRSAHTTAASVRCELCQAPASLFCPADNACLCQSCDALVHQANFLVSRHARSPLCTSCGQVARAQEPHCCVPKKEKPPVTFGSSREEDEGCLSSTVSSGSSSERHDHAEVARSCKVVRSGSSSVLTDKLSPVCDEIRNSKRKRRATSPLLRRKRSSSSSSSSSASASSSSSRNCRSPLRHHRTELFISSSSFSSSSSSS